MSQWRRLIARSLARPAQWGQLSLTMLFAAAVTLLLVLGVRGAGRLQAASSALQLATQLSERPQLLAAQLTLIQRGLEATTYVGESLSSLTALQRSSSNALRSLRAALLQARLLEQPGVTESLVNTELRWLHLDRDLSSISDLRGGLLYIDASTGSRLSASGKAMKAGVDGMLSSGAHDLQQMSVDMSGLAALLRTTVDDSGLRLRALLIAGSALAGLMLGLMLYHAWRSRLARQAAEQAQLQVANILSTVREGLFLVDQQMRLSPTYSDSLRELLRRPAPAGLRIEELLEPLVDAKTVSATLKYLGLLWKGKVHEELIESVNPLSEIEVAFANPRGGSELRHLAFSFRRVRSAARAGDYILGVVSDVTERVLLARELESVRAEGDSQTALQTQLRHIEPQVLQAFLWSADVALRKSNAVLTVSGIEQEDLKKKVNAVFRELHIVKGEAAALALHSCVQRIHAIEDVLSALRQQSSLSGNDFLPVVVRLDELVSHLDQMRSLHERRAEPAQRGERAGAADEQMHEAQRSDGALERPRSPLSAPAAAGRAQQFAEMLRALTLEEARALGRSVRLLTRGLVEIPPHYVTVVKEICVQMLRNAIAHGIEPPAQRLHLGKAEEGTVQISFALDESGEYTLTVEDDGHGLNYEQIVERALRLDLLSAQQALTLDWDNIYRLIFEPGFSTADAVSEHAGRGVGLDAVSARLREVGGKISVSTAAGVFTRFHVLLPRLGASSAASVA
jgi:hypothetical protein